MNKNTELNMYISGISLLEFNNYYDYSATISPNDGVVRTVRWTCDDEDMINISTKTTSTSNGIARTSISARRVGQTIIRATTDDGLSAEHHVFVKETEIIESFSGGYYQKGSYIYIDGVARYLAYANDKSITFRNLVNPGIQWSYSPTSAYQLFYASYDRYVYVVYYDAIGDMHINKIDVVTQNIIINKTFTPSKNASYYNPKCSANKYGLVLSTILTSYVFDENLNQLLESHASDYVSSYAYMQWVDSSEEYHYVLISGKGYLKISNSGEIVKEVNFNNNIKSYQISVLTEQDSDAVFISIGDILHIYKNDILKYEREVASPFGALLNLPDRYAFVNGSWNIFASINIKPGNSHRLDLIYRNKDISYEPTFPLGCNRFSATRYMAGENNSQRLYIFKTGNIGNYFTMSVKFNNDNITGRVGETHKALITYEPSNSTETDFYYYVEDESIADVDMEGNVTFKKIGVTKLFCLEVNSGKRGETLLTSLTNVVDVTGISLNYNSINGFVGDNYILKASIEPIDASNKNVIWSSSNTEAVHVDYDGVITLKQSASSVIITCTTEDSNFTDSCVVSVRPVLVTNIILDKSHLNIEKGKSIRVGCSVYPVNATTKTVLWETSNSSVAIVDSNGVVTAISEGDCIISASSIDGSEIRSECNIKVMTNIISVTDVVLDKSRLDMFTGDSSKLNVTILPENATIKDVVWNSSDDSVVSVDNSGNLIALKKGNCVVSVKSVDGDMVANCVVSVRDVISTNITLNKQNISVEKNKLYQLNAVIQPPNTTNKTVVWTSENNDIATVTSTGLVRGMDIGKCRITARTVDSNLNAICSVDVIAEIFPVQSISLSKNSLEIGEMSSGKLEYTIIPTNASNKNVRWTSSDEGIAKVDSYGNVYGFSPGECLITVTTEDGEKVDTCIVNVKSSDGIFESIDIITDKNIINNKMTRVGIKFKTKSDLPNNVIFNAVVNYVGQYKIRDIQLEKGNVMTDVSNSVYETNTKLETVKERVKSAELKLTPDGIKAIVSENFYDKSDIDTSYSKKSEVEQLAGSITSVVTEVSKHDGQINNMESKIEQTAGQIASKVSANDVSSIIRQSPDDIQIGFNGVSDYVTINTNGLTVNKGYVACDTLTTPEGSNPIIKLFPNGSQHCSIDATAYGEGGGRGDAIRMKWNSGNYYLINNRGAEIYLDYDNSPKYGFYPGSAYLRSDYIGIGSYGGNINTNGGALRLWSNGYDTGIRVNSGGSIDFVYNGMTKHQFLTNGTKYGGSIDIEGESYGMSPIDSPHMLIEDVLFDINVNEENTIIYLSELYSKSVKKYAVFPSNGKVEVIEKHKDYFIVNGYDCVCDFRIVGKRIDSEDIYFKKME